MIYCMLPKQGTFQNTTCNEEVNFTGIVLPSPNPRSRIFDMLHPTPGLARLDQPVKPSSNANQKVLTRSPRPPRSGVPSHTSALRPEPPPKPLHLHSISSRIRPRNTLESATISSDTSIYDPRKNGVSFATGSIPEFEDLLTKEHIQSHKLQDQNGKIDPGPSPRKKAIDAVDLNRDLMKMDQLLGESNLDLGVYIRSPSHSVSSSYQAYSKEPAILERKQSGIFEGSSREGHTYAHFETNEQDSPCSTIRARPSRNKLANVRAIYSLMQQSGVGEASAWPNRSDIREDTPYSSTAHSLSYDPRVKSTPDEPSPVYDISSIDQMMQGSGKANTGQGRGGHPSKQETCDTRSVANPSLHLRSQLSMDLIDPRLFPEAVLSKPTLIATPQFATDSQAFGQILEDGPATTGIGLHEGAVSDFGAKDLGYGWSSGHNLGFSNGMHSTERELSDYTQASVGLEAVGLVPKGFHEVCVCVCVIMA